MSELGLLTATAVSVAFLHTVIGPDHYVPFVALARARGWTQFQMALTTVACGIGHVAGSVVLGLAGLALGLSLRHVQIIESARADAVAWLMIAFGLTYLTWGFVCAARNAPHTHRHAHADGTIHSHPHVHDLEHMHVHESVTRPTGTSESTRAAERQGLTAWVLFIVFVLGPCEPLIPLLILPGAEKSWMAFVIVVLAFGLTTVLTMCVCALALYQTSASVPRLGIDLHRYAHALAGFAVLLCGVLIKVGL